MNGTHNNGLALAVFVAVHGRDAQSAAAIVALGAMLVQLAIEVPLWVIGVDALGAHPAQLSIATKHT